MKDLKIAVIGYGYWGPNLVRNFTNLENSTVSHVVDESPDRLEKVKKLYPSINATSSLTEILENPIRTETAPESCRNGSRAALGSLRGVIWSKSC